MKVEVKDNYPEQVKDYTNDYNNAVEEKDIMEVDLAINGLITLVFSKDENLRQYAIIVLTQIGKAQYKFLKNAVKVLLRRYTGDDREKSDIASIALGEIISTPAAKLIKEQDVLQKIIEEQRERLSIKEKEERMEKEFIEKASTVQVDLSMVQAFPDIYNIGLFYNKSRLDDKNDEAFQSIQELIGKLFQWYDENKSYFTAGTIFLSQLSEEEKRPPFYKSILDYLMGFLQKGKDHEKEIVTEIFIRIYEQITDLLENDFMQWITQQRLKKEEEKEVQQKKETERRKYLQKVKVTPKLKWATETQKLAKDYNDFVAIDKKKDREKNLNQVFKSIEKDLSSDVEFLWRSTGEFLNQLLESNLDFVVDIFKNLIKNYRKEKSFEILFPVVDKLEELNLIKPQIKEEIIENHNQLVLQKQKEREEREKERQEIDSKTIKYNGDWEKSIINITKDINKNLIKNNESGAAKIIDNDLKEVLQAKKDEIRNQAQEIFIRLAEKFPHLLSKIVEEYLALFQDEENAARFIAVEVFGKTYHSGNIKKILPNIADELVKKIEADYDERRKEIENLLMSEKISHIKIDVQTIPINDDWPKDIKKICRNYNDAILKQKMEDVVEAVKKIVDIFMNENAKKENRLNASIDIIGLIGKKNIELISPTIDMLLEMVDRDDLDKKYRAIKALGEISKQRPGWAYMGIDKLMKTAENDEDQEARMKSMLELSRIGKKNPIMLVEYVDNIIRLLSNDPNKHVRRLAAWTLGMMAEAIPLEAKEAIPALTEALHDDYVLVRKFADKALQLIRAAMRKV